MQELAAALSLMTLKTRSNMLYDVNFYTLEKLMLPPVMRSKIVLSLLNVLTLPVRYVYSLFASLRALTDRKLNITPNVIVLERLLNDVCSTQGIYLRTPETKSYLTMFYEIEDQSKTYFRKKKENRPVYAYKGNEVHAEASFIVMIPTAVGSAAYIERITNTLNLYKPAGKNYRTVLI